jgi:hypothetical protein
LKILKNMGNMFFISITKIISLQFKMILNC